MLTDRSAKPGLGYAQRVGILETSRGLTFATCPQKTVNIINVSGEATRSIESAGNPWVTGAQPLNPLRNLHHSLGF